MGPDPDVLLDRQFGENAPPLGHLGDAQGHDLLGTHFVDGLPVELDGALFDFAVLVLEQTGDGPQGGRLAGPVRAEEGDDFPIRNFQ